MDTQIRISVMKALEQLLHQASDRLETLENALSCIEASEIGTDLQEQQYWGKIGADFIRVDQTLDRCKELQKITETKVTFREHLFVLMANRRAKHSKQEAAEKTLDTAFVRVNDLLDRISKARYALEKD